MKMYIRNLQTLALKMNRRYKMKPIVFYDFYSIGKDRIEVEREKFEKLLKDVYDAGFEDGKNSKAIPWFTPQRGFGDVDVTCDSNVKRDPINTLHMETTCVSDRI